MNDLFGGNVIPEEGGEAIMEMIIIRGFYINLFIIRGWRSNEV